MDRHTAIYQTYSNVIKIEGDPEKEVCRDKDENIVTIDNSVIASLIAANKYKTDRTTDGSTTYDTIGNQLDMLYADMLAGKLDTTGTWATHIKAVKDANPKSS
jgi:hypothetical protein